MTETLILNDVPYKKFHASISPPRRVLTVATDDPALFNLFRHSWGVVRDPVVFNGEYWRDGQAYVLEGGRLKSYHRESMAWTLEFKTIIKAVR